MTELPPENPNAAPGAFPERPPRVYLDAFPLAFRYFRADWANWSMASALCLGLASVLCLPAMLLGNMLAVGKGANLFDPDKALKPVLIEWVISLVPTTMLMGVFAGMVVMAHCQIRGKPYGLSTIWEGFQNPVGLVTASILFQSLFLLGLNVCFIPGFFLAGRLAFAPVLPGLEGLDGFKAIKRSWTGVRFFAFSMFNVLFLCALTNALGLVTCGLANIVGLPVAALVIAFHYVWLLGDMPSVSLK